MITSWWLLSCLDSFMDVAYHIRNSDSKRDIVTNDNDVDDRLGRLA